MAGAENRFVGVTKGRDQSVARLASILRRGVRSMIDAIEGVKVVLVYDYHPTTQRVDVVLKDVPAGTTHTDFSPVFENVPIAWTGGDLVVGQSFKTILGGFTDDPDFGWLIFTKEDSRDSLKFRAQAPPITETLHGGLGCFFVPGGLIEGETLDPTIVADESPTPEQIGPDDRFVLDRRTGSRTVYKANGDIHILAAGNVYIGGLGQTIASMEKVIRAGDSGDGGIGAGPLPTPGTRRVYVA